MRTLVVVPTYNEKANLTELIPRVLGQRPDIEMLVVDDGSPDGTGKYAEEAAARDSRIHVLHRPRKMGLGSAYVEGFRHALTTDVELVVQMDADFSHDPDVIPQLIDKAADYDVVLGSRYITGANVVNWPLRRLFLSYFANVYTHIVTGLPLRDSTGGFKCFRRRVLEEIELDTIRSDGYSFQIEVNFRSWRKGFSVVEIPIVFVDRHSGTSKMSRRIVWEAMWLVWRLRLERMLLRP
ncbi:MAG: polyprenol monophosphomannose synthase [Candidatus Eisenbacteria bacterium]|nr:polyprenol monophosphomannose synthase [Candidatus Eisenbacteria bacterium]